MPKGGSEDPPFGFLLRSHLTPARINTAGSIKTSQGSKRNGRTTLSDAPAIYSVASCNYSVADSSFFIIEKMNTAESRHSTISTLHTIQRAIPLPQR